MDMFAKYKAASQMLTQHTRKAVLNGRPFITWADGVRFSYERKVREGQDINTVEVFVDSITGREEIRKADSAREKVKYEHETGRKIGVVNEEKYTNSPDGKYALYTKDYNLVLVNNETNEETVLTVDGEKDKEYGCYVDIYSQISVKRDGHVEHPQVLFSPDGRFFVTYCCDRRNCPKLYLIESFVDSVENIRPGLWEYRCPFVVDGDDEIPHYSLFVGDVENRTMKKVDAPDFLYPLFTSSDRSFVKWMDDSKEFYFTWIARGFKEAAMYLCNPVTNTTKMLVHETTDTFLNLGAFGLVDGYGTYLFSNFITGDRKYVFWQSEKNGYAHLYRFELTKVLEKCADNCQDGTWEDVFCDSDRELIVQKIIKVDEENKKVYFMGNNDRECSDPLYYQLYVISFEGGSVVRLTPEDATHTVSMGVESFVDTFSRVDMPPVTVLRKNDGTFIRELERADVSKLLENGYVYPERFTVKAEDGMTELCGILVKPADFDPKKTYPVIDYIYGGPQLYNVPRDFTWDNSMNREIMGGLQEFAQLGFVGIIIDGRGTPGRGKKFHEFCYENIHGCAGLCDHVYALRELKEKYPFIDLDRVGIWGNSGGGYATVSAMLEYPKIYKVGVASAGNYDQRMYEHSWTERYNGLYREEVYEKGDITRLAGNLSGKLLLAYGAMDDNVPMSQTLRLCDELNKYNKDYDLVVIPRKNHNVPSDMYFIRRKMDFFVKHLLGEEPPVEFRFEV